VDIAFAAPEEPDKKDRIADRLNRMGLILQDLGDLDSALEHHRWAAQLDEDHTESRRLARDLNNIGSVLLSKGQLEEARGLLERSLRIHRQRDAEEGPRRGSSDTASSLTNLGLELHLRGHLERARRLYLEALKIEEAIDPRSEDVATILNNLAGTYLAEGELDSAIAQYGRAAAIDREVSPRSVELARDLSNMGTAFENAGDLDRASQFYREAEGILAEVAPTSVERASVLANLGDTAWARRDSAALGPYRHAEELLRDVAPRSAEMARVLNNMGLVMAEAGDLGSAQRSYEDAAAIAERTTGPSRVWMAALTNLGALHHSMGDLGTALQQLENAVVVVEALRGSAGGPQARERVYAQGQWPYRLLITFLYERNALAHRDAVPDRERAFHIAERSRARALLDMLAEGHLEIEPDDLDQRHLVERERDLSYRLAANRGRLQQVSRLPDPDGELLERIRQEGAGLAQALEALRTDLRENFPQYQDLRYPEPVTARQAQDLLGSDVLLLEFAALEDETYLWALRSKGFDMKPTGLTSGDLEGLIDRAVGAFREGRQSLGGEDQAHERQEARTELGEALLGPIPTELFDGARRLAIVPDGLLSYLPLECLPVPPRIRERRSDPGNIVLLGDMCATSYVPSATVLATLEATPRQGATAGFIGFGDPSFAGQPSTGVRRAAALGGSLCSLPGTRAEVAGVVSSFGGSGLYGPRATEHQAKTTTAGHRYVHFATHALLDDSNPLYSGLALAPPTSPELAADPNLDDLLQVWEMFGLPFEGTEVVVCSACQTGLGKLHAGEGLVGMARALLFAGARCIVASLWPVPDRPTARLIGRFYQGLRSGKPPADALQWAKADVRKSHPLVYRDPYAWAGFVSIGVGWP
jgi:CHAT domain-containing protein/tetratricopeptide (TPR) repeat protein